MSLLTRNKTEEAFESLKFYRTCGGDTLSIERIEKEFELMKAALSSKNEVKLEFYDLCE